MGTMVHVGRSEDNLEHWFSPAMMEDSDQIQVVGLGTKCLYLLSPHIILLNLRFNFLFNSVLVL